MTDNQQNIPSKSTRIKQTMKTILQKTQNTASNIYTKGRQKSIDSYHAAKQIASKGKEKSQQLYSTTKQKTSQAYDSIKEKVRNRYDKSKQSQELVQKQQTENRNKVHQIDNKSSNTAPKPKQLPKKKSTKINLLDNLIRDIVIGTAITSFSTLAIKNAVGLLGFKLYGVAKCSLAALYQSKVVAIYSKSLFALLQSAAMKSTIVTYAPIVIPTVVVTYVGVKIVINVVDARKIKKQEQAKKLTSLPTLTEIKPSDNIGQNEQRFKNTIQISTLNNWMKKAQHSHHHKSPQYTL